jgi:hypothetical protein
MALRSARARRSGEPFSAPNISPHADPDEAPQNQTALRRLSWNPHPSSPMLVHPLPRTARERGYTSVFRCGLGPAGATEVAATTAQNPPSRTARAVVCAGPAEAQFRSPPPLRSACEAGAGGRREGAPEACAEPRRTSPARRRLPMCGPQPLSRRLKPQLENHKVRLRGLHAKPSAQGRRKRSSGLPLPCAAGDGGRGEGAPAACDEPRRTSIDLYLLPHSRTPALTH